MDYKKVDLDKYYRKGTYNHFTKDCKCSVSITNRIDVTSLKEFSDKTKSKFYINFLYVLGKAINSRDDYKMAYLWQTDEVVVFEKVNITHYVFFEDLEICTPVYTEFDFDYSTFYKRCEEDIARAKETKEYHLDSEHHINYFDASYVSWLSYDSLNIELPDGHLYYQPIINWGRYKKEGNKLMMPLTVRLNHAIADGYLVSKVFETVEREILKLGI